MSTGTEPAVASSDPGSDTDLPEQPEGLIGRDEAVRMLARELRRRRVVSIVGPGGIGKTSLAGAAANRLAGDFADGVRQLDMTRHGTLESAARELAIALGVDPAAGAALPALRERLRPLRTLVLLDSCEAAIDTAAALAEALANEAAPGVRLLATSREALDVGGEWVYRIQPLACPPGEGELPLWLASTYSAVQLFARVAAAGGHGFALDTHNAPIVASICRRLDGNPLALTLAASRVAELGIDGVATQLGEQMLGWRSGSGGQARHQSLEAVIDWSFRLLGNAERQVFRSLATFRAQFSLEAAAAVAGDVAPGQAAAIVLDLVAKSLLTAQPVAGDTVYRFFDTTRSYAEQALEQAPAEERAGCRQRHARLLIRMLAAADLSWHHTPPTVWRLQYGVWAGDLRAALSWAFSASGDRDIGVELTAASLAFANQTALIGDYDHYAQRALLEVATMDPPRPDLELKLHAFPAVNQMAGLVNQPTQLATLRRAVTLGHRAGTAPAQLVGLLALWAESFQSGGYRTALDLSARMQQLADDHDDMAVDITAKRTRAQALHFLGEHAAAKALALQVCARLPFKVPLIYTPSPVSMAVSMRILLVRIHWLEGRADQAWQVADDCLRHAEEDHPRSVCQTLALAAIPLALWCGRAEAARAWIERLDDEARRCAYTYWQTWAALFESMLVPPDGTTQERPVRPVRPVEWAALRSSDQSMLRDHAGTFRTTAGADDAYLRAVRGEVGWCAPEILRAEALRTLHAGGTAALGRARALIGAALDLARSQGALAWELRAALSALQVDKLTGNAGAALAQLAAIRSRFSEGFGTRDLLEADAALGATR